MRLRLLLVASFALAAILAPPLAAAWGNPAHRVVAGLAQAQLRPAAAAEASRLLAAEPEPTLAGVSGWADTVREDGGQAGRRTKRWHYVDFKGEAPGCDYLPPRDCPDGDCVVAAINREFLALSDRRRPDAERAEALKYLVHLVADVHQPLHASPKADKGGLDFQVSWRGKGDNLHLVWDVRLLEREFERSGVDEAGYLRALQALPALPLDPTRRSDRPAVDWAQESCRIVRDGALYPSAHVLGDEYLDAHRAQLEEQLRRAGSRLADMLNFALDPQGIPMNTPLVHSKYHADTGTWCHVVADPASKAAAIIDPVLDYEAKGARTGTGFAAAVLALCAAEGYRVCWLLETHAHADHLSAAEWLQAQTGAPVCIGAGIRNVQAAFKPIYGFEAEFPTDGSQFDRLFNDGEHFALGELHVEVIATPGHTSDSLSYLVGDAVFVGDSIFMPDGGTARCDFPGGDAQVLFRSIQRLYALPDETRVFVCHDYGPGGREPREQTSIAEQKRANIHVRADTPSAEFVELRTKRDATLALPALILPAVQVNIRGGRLPSPDASGRRFLSFPLDAL